MVLACKPHPAASIVAVLPFFSVPHPGIVLQPIEDESRSSK